MPKSPQFGPAEEIQYGSSEIPQELSDQYRTLGGGCDHLGASCRPRVLGFILDLGDQLYSRPHVRLERDRCTGSILLPFPGGILSVNNGWIVLRGCSGNNLRKIDVAIPRVLFTVAPG